MSARQLIILAVAAIAAIGALLIIRGLMSQPKADPNAAIAGQQVLVAVKDIAQGAALTGEDIAWRKFPEDSVNETFITQASHPEALTEMQNAVTRRAFVAGEPFTLNSIVQPDDHSFMAAQLAPGMRAVAIEIDSATAAAGYLGPNDRVDVVMTYRAADSESRGQARSAVILADVRVLAIDDKTNPQKIGEGPTQYPEITVALLELSQADAARLRQADMMGDISLALRGVQTETGPAASAAQDIGALEGGGGSGGVLIHAFGNAYGGSR
jgi:pilus assembly protein CpaB